MIHYILTEPDGKIKCAGSTGGSGAEAEAGLLAALPGAIIVPHPLANVSGSYWGGANVQSMGGPPSEHHVFDYATKQWRDPRTLQDHKNAKWAEIKRARSEAVAAPLLETPFGVFDADAVGLRNIESAVTGLREAAAINKAPASIEWTLADNSVVSLTHDGLSEVATLLLARGNAAHAKARQLRAQIESAGSVEALTTVAWQ